jgi:hypothetical protein
MKYHKKSSKGDKSKGGGNGTSTKKSIFKPKSKKEYKFTPLDSTSSIAQASYASVKAHLLVYIQKEFGTGMLDIYDSIDKEEKIDLSKELPVVKTSKSSDDKVADQENKAFQYHDYRDDMKIYKQRVLTFKENLVKAYGLIWDDYMTATMQNRIEQHPDYESKIKNNPVELMLAIRASMHESVRAQHTILTLFLALTKFFTYKQKEDMTNVEYLKGFKEHRDVFKTQWGTKITDEYAERQPEYAKLTSPGSQTKFKVLIQDPADRLPVSAIQSYYVRAGQQDVYLPVTYLLGIPAPLQSSQ